VVVLLEACETTSRQAMLGQPCVTRPMDIEERLLSSSPLGDAFLIVGVACFAGDVAAPSELVSALPADCDAALIFVEQQSAGREGLFAEALAKRATLPVVRAEDGLTVERGRIYLIPKDVAPTITHCRIRLIAASKEIHCPADTLLISLAQEAGDHAIGVILSGGASEQALGLRAVRQAGGVTFAQYPGCARFPNTPIDAIDTGCVDFVLRPNEIAHALTRISRSKKKAPRGAFEHTQITYLEPILTQHAPPAASSLAE
jgi:two-component system, chemotaxis family, CheB/CheR fusion protein